MWVADDYKWKSFFIEKRLCEFWIHEKKYVAVMMEAHSFPKEEQFEFFRESKRLCKFYFKNLKEKLEYILRYNYGNLFYSLFERDALYEKDCYPFDTGGNIKYFNENFLYLVVMKHGNWRVVPQLGFIKKTNARTYEQAKWEKKGSVLPNFTGFLYYRGLPREMKYHWTVLKEIEATIDRLRVDIYNNDLRKLACKSILKHFYYMLIRHKPPHLRRDFV
jgi:hypothetical protein